VVRDWSVGRVKKNASPKQHRKRREKKASATRVPCFAIRNTGRKSLAWMTATVVVTGSVNPTAARRKTWLKDM